MPESRQNNKKHPCGRIGAGGSQLNGVGGWWRMLLGVCLLQLGACGGTSPDPQTNYAKTIKARAYLENGNPEAAEKLLKQVASEDASAQSLVNLGLAQAALQHWSKAAASWKKAHELEPLDARSSYHLARWELRRAQEGKAPESDAAITLAIEYLEQARQRVPRNAAVLRLLSDAYFVHGDSLLAQALVKDAERFDPGRAGRVAEAFGLSQIVVPEFQRSPSVTRHATKFHVQELEVQARGLVQVPMHSAAAASGILLQGTRVWLRNAATVAPENIRWAAEPLLEKAILGGVSAPFDADAIADIVVWSRPLTKSARGKRQPMRTQLWFVRGTRDSMQATALFAVPYDILDMQALDFDQDGDVDLLVGASGKPGVRLWRNDGAGNFAIDEVAAWFEATLPTQHLTSADLNGDHIADVISIDTNGKLQVWAGRRHGRFSDVTTLAGLGGVVARTASIADLDGDGLGDLLLGDDQGLWIYVNRGIMRFEKNAAYRDARGGWSGNQDRGVPVAGIQIADFDNDGKLDIITQHFNDPNRRKVIAQTNNAMPLGSVATEDTAPGGQGRSLLAVPDRVRLALWRNEGHGILADVTVRAGLDELWVLPSRPLIADLDQDGDLDLACIGVENQVHLLWNRGEATNRRLVCELVDARRPSRAFGAHVQAYAGRRVMQSAPSSGRVSLGVGTLEQLDVLCVRWADGYVQNILDPASLLLDRRQTVSVVRIERDAVARR